MCQKEEISIDWAIISYKPHSTIRYGKHKVSSLAS